MRMRNGSSLPLEFMKHNNSCIIVFFVLSLLSNWMITIVLLPYVSFGPHSPSQIRPDYSLALNLVFNLILPAAIALALAVLAVLLIHKKAVLHSSERVFLIGSIVNSFITYTVLYVAAFCFYTKTKTSLYDVPDLVAFPLSLSISAVLLFSDWSAYAKVRRENGRAIEKAGSGGFAWTFLVMSILSFGACSVLFFEPLRIGSEGQARIDYSIVGNVVGNIIVPSAAALILATLSVVLSVRKSYSETSRKSRLISAIVTTIFALTLCLSIFPYLVVGPSSPSIYAVLSVVPLVAFFEVFFVWRGFLKKDVILESKNQPRDN